MNLRGIMKKLIVILSAAGLAAIGSAQVINGGFETGDFTGWTTNPAGSGSLFGVDPGAANFGSFGAYFGAVDGIPDEIFQNVGATNGASYVLTVWVNNQGATGGDNIEIQWEGGDVYNAPGPVGWTALNFNVTAHSAAPEVRIGSYDGPDFHYVDDVSLTPVPEPATLGALGLGAVALILRRRRR